jgi:Ricin-type beta-trefoil lectin domain
MAAMYRLAPLVFFGLLIAAPVVGCSSAARPDAPDAGAATNAAIARVPRAAAVDAGHAALPEGSEQLAVERPRIPLPQGAARSRLAIHPLYSGPYDGEAWGQIQEIGTNNCWQAYYSGSTEYIRTTTCSDNDYTQLFQINDQPNQPTQSLAADIVTWDDNCLFPTGQYGAVEASGCGSDPYVWLATYTSSDGGLYYFQGPIEALGGGLDEYCLSSYCVIDCSSAPCKTNTYSSSDSNEKFATVVLTSGTQPIADTMTPYAGAAEGGVSGGFVLDLYYDDSYDGAEIDITSYNGSPAQFWTYDESTSQIQLMSDTSWCLTVQPGHGYAGGPVTLYACNAENLGGSGNLYQQWYAYLNINTNPNDYVVSGTFFVNGYSNNCLDAPLGDFETGGGTVADNWTCNLGANQSWLFTPSWSGAF